MKRQVPNKLLDILENWLYGSNACVKWGNLWSNICTIKFGVRQGSVLSPVLFMVALCNRADHYIFILFLSSSFTVALCNRETIYIFMLFLLSSSFFFPRLISAVGDLMFTILWHMVWP